MTKKTLTIYTTGQIYVSEGNARMGIVGGQIDKEIDITMATPDEVTVLLSNPNNTQLIEEISKRVYTD